MRFGTEIDLDHRESRLSTFQNADSSKRSGLIPPVGLLTVQSSI